MSFFDFSISREFFFYNSRKKPQNFKSNLEKLNTTKLCSVNLAKIKFSKPRLLKNFLGFSNFPFLVLSNGSLVFYNSTYSSFLFDSSLPQSGLLLFDDLYSYKNKIVF